MTPLDEIIDENFVLRLSRGEPWVFEGQLEDKDGNVEPLDGRTFYGCVMAADGTRLREAVAEFYTDKSGVFYRGVIDGSMSDDLFGQSGLLWWQGERTDAGVKPDAQGSMVIYPGPGVHAPEGPSGIAAIATRFIRRATETGRTRIRKAQTGARGPAPWDAAGETLEAYNARVAQGAIDAAATDVGAALLDLGQAFNEKSAEIDEALAAAEVKGGGLISGGGAVGSKPTLTVEPASDAEVIEGTVTTKAVTPKSARAAMRTIDTGLLSLARFNPDRSGKTDQHALIQRAIIEAAGSGYSGLMIPPGDYGIERSSPPLYVPGAFTTQGVRQRSRLLGLGSVFPDALPFPVQSQSMIAVASVGLTPGFAFGERYLKETGRVGGTGATFAVTVTAGAVTAATVAAGGIGYKVGDIIFLPNGTSFTVATSSGGALGRGAVQTVTIRLGGAGWGEPVNPVAQIRASGQKLWDRILDPATFAEPVVFRDLVLDGAWGGDAAGSHAILPVGKLYSGLIARGSREVTLDGVVTMNFPNDGASLVDNKRGRLLRSSAFNCGWTGAPTSSRNGFSNSGVCVTQAPAGYTPADINTDDWLISDVDAVCCGDVGIEYRWIKGVIERLRIRDFGTIGLEGQGTSTAFDTAGETRNNNGGVEIPADLVVDDVRIDGTRSRSATWANVTAPNTGFSGAARADLPYGMDGWTHSAGNEGHIIASGIRVKNTLRRAIALTQAANGRISLLDSYATYVGRGSTLAGISNAPICEIGARWAQVKALTIRGYEVTASNYDSGNQQVRGGVILVLSYGFMQQMEVSDLDVDGVFFSNILQVAGQQGGGGQYARFKNWRISRSAGARVIDWNQQLIAKYQELDVSGHSLVNISQDAASDQTQSYYSFRTTGSGRLDADVVRLDNNQVTSNSIYRPAPTTPVFDFGSTAFGEVSLRGNLMPGFLQARFAAPPGSLRSDQPVVVSAARALSGGTATYMCYTDFQAFTVTLPSNPAVNDTITIEDASGSFAARPLTVARNGKTMRGAAADLVLNTAYARTVLRWTGSTWTY